MTRFEKTYKWLKPFFEKLIEIQETNGIVLDGCELAGKFGIDDKKQMIYSFDGTCKVVYFGTGWCDEITETKKYWQERLKKFRFAEWECVQSLNIKG